jgi:hypothetical protein
MVEYKKQFRVYKANGANTGSAISIDFNAEKESVFLEFAKQKEQKSFDWQNKLTIKLSTLELAKINVFYKDKGNEVKLFHDPSKGDYKSEFKNAVLNVSKLGNNYNFRLNQQSPDGKLNSISVNLTPEEMYITTTLFRKIIEDIYIK